jgi:electron transfer flavoprotein alpha subunit
MAGILIFAEHSNGQIADATVMAAGFARALADKAKCELAALLLGSEEQRLITVLAEHGVDRVLLCNVPALVGCAPEAATYLAASAFERYQPDLFVFAETLTGSDLARRVAASLRLGLTAHCTTIAVSSDRRMTVTRLGYAERLQTTTPATPIVVLHEGIGEVQKNQRLGQVEVIELKLPSEIQRLQYVETIKADPKKIPLSQAEFIVSGGNGVNDFALLSELANKLKAAIGGSRVVCDDGRLPRERQIGESGTTVKPRCYIAIGISGASQHIRGMQESKLIIAVNTDRHAPLMKMANMAVVADAAEVMRAMLECLDSV